MGAPVPPLTLPPQGASMSVGSATPGAGLGGAYGMPSAPWGNSNYPVRSPQPELASITDPLPQLAPMDETGGIKAAFAANLEKGRKETGLFKGNDVAASLGIIGDALMAYGGLNPQFAPRMAREAEQERQMEFDREKWSAEMEAERQKRLAPKVEQVGNTIGMFDPASLSYNPIFTAPQPWELYARSLGYEPGTNDYRNAIEEYRAGTWGDEGVAGRLAVQQPRLDLSRENNIRSTSTSRDNNIRSTSTSRANNIRSTGTSRDNNVRSTSTGRENSVRSNDTRLRTTRRNPRAAGSVSSEAVAVGPDGRRYVVRNGQWVPAN